MTIKDILERLQGREEPDEQDDEVTKDRVLRSLRRERRVQMEEEEKKLLKAQIAKYKKDKVRKELWGVTDNSKPQGYYGKEEKAREILKQKQALIGRDSMLNNRKDEFKRAKSTKMKFI